MTRVIFVFWGLFCALSLGVLVVCLKTPPQFEFSLSKTDFTTPVQDAGPTRALLEKYIRDIDFRNFTFPWEKNLIDPTKASQKTFTLQNGFLPPTRDRDRFIEEMGIRLVGINYGDVNGDKIEDAIIVISFQTGGSALPNSVYVYTCYSNKKPILLWAFSTGDRADGGLRDVYIQKDGIVVELYSPIDKEGDCCPVFFSRAFYSWKGNGFNIASKEELLPNTEKAATLHFRPDRLPKP